MYKQSSKIFEVPCVEMNAIGCLFQLRSTCESVSVLAILDVSDPLKVVDLSGCFGTFGRVPDCVVQVGRGSIAIECEALVGNNQQDDSTVP